MNGTILGGRASDAWCTGVGPGRPGNTESAMSWDGTNLGAQWRIWGMTIDVCCVVAKIYCTPISTESSTWGGIKTLYRQSEFLGARVKRGRRDVGPDFFGRQICRKIPIVLLEPLPIMIAANSWHLLRRNVRISAESGNRGWIEFRGRHGHGVLTGSPGMTIVVQSARESQFLVKKLSTNDRREDYSWPTFFNRRR